MLGFAAIQTALGFSVYGPLETWQTGVLDYDVRYYYGNDIELGGTKNFGEGSRLNVPILTYAYDTTFLQYFGAKGVAAIDAAMKEMNSLPTASSAKLSKFLMQDNQAINYTAQALSLTDLKSVVMALMLEHMGLIGETHVWDLAARAAPAGAAACFFDYIVVNRNYDPVTYNPTAYVNGVQYGYTIWEGCPTGVDVADAVEQSVDLSSPAQFAYTAVATRYAQQVGGYYLGITRDDMGGLAYLYRANNYANEFLDANSVLEGVAGSWSPFTTNTITTTTTAATNAAIAGIFGGVEKISFVKVAYDSLLGTAFTPRTYPYTVTVVNNGIVRQLKVARTIVRPDIVFAAGNLLASPFALPFGEDEYARGNGPDDADNFIGSDVASLGTDTVTPGVIVPQTVITFNNVTPIYVNYSPAFLDSTQISLYPVLNWGSFDGTTNAPVVYPIGSSINTLEAQVLAGGPSINLGTYTPFSTNTTATTNGVTP